MIMNNAIGHFKNVTFTSRHITSVQLENGSEPMPYWQYAALLQPQAAEQLHVQPQQLAQHLPPAFTRNDNHSLSSAPTTPSHPSQFYSNFNVSDDLFYYFNGFIERGDATDTASISTATPPLYVDTNTLPAEIINSTSGPLELDLAEFLSSLPNDRVSLLSFLFLFSFATVFGNSLVILAVIRERYLHTATNYFITSLAVADCLVGLVVMPFSALYEVLENTWFFGTDWCDIWRSLDVLFSTASILNLCVISLDRYWAITDPFSYPMRMTVKRAAALICAVWVCSSAISFPAIVWWRAARDGEMPAYKCTFTEHLGYLVFSSTISFYLPLLVMVFTYCRIYRAAVIQTRSLKIGTKQVLMASGELQLTLRIHRGGTTREPSTSSHHQALHGSLGGVPSGGSQHHSHAHHHHRTSHHNHSSAGTTTSTPEEPDDEPLSALHNNGLARHRHMGGKNFSWSRKLAKFAKEKKAAKTLGIVMGVFIVCWLPFFVVNLLSGFCMECIEHEEIVSAVVTWLGWINSCMNPVIYACWSRDFRRAFVRLLCVCCPRKIRRKYQPTMRSKSQLSSCSSCSGSSNCGRNSVLQQQQHQQHHRHRHHHHHPSPQQHQIQQQQLQRTCTRCQSFHRHNHRQRRRSSVVHFGSASNVANITKAIVTITPPVTSGTATTNTAITPSSLTSFSMNSPLNTSNSPGTLSCATTPMGSVAASKHCSFALTPITIPPPPNKVSFLSTAKFHSPTSATSLSTIALVSVGAKASPATTPLSPHPGPSTPRDRTQVPDENMKAVATKLHNHQQLEMRQSVTSQITTVEDVDEICKLPVGMETNNINLQVQNIGDGDDDDDYDDDVDVDVMDVDALQYAFDDVISPRRYSSCSNSSHSSSAAAVFIRDNIIP